MFCMMSARIWFVGSGGVFQCVLVFSCVLECVGMLRFARCRVECVAGVAVMALRVQRTRDTRSGVAVCV